MSYARTDTVASSRISSRPSRVLGRLCALLTLLVVANAAAQPGRWDAQEVTYQGVSKAGAKIELDRWGNQHVIWAQQANWGLKGTIGGQQDPTRAGIQLFYSTDATGIFSAPIQATDTTSGSVYHKDSIRTPWVFKLDRFGSAHIAYLANHGGHITLFYASNADTSTRRFTVLEGLYQLPPTTDTLAFDMAVDSNGKAHIVWIDRSESNGEAKVYLWPGQPFTDPNIPLVTLPCPGGLTGCSVGTPRIEVTPDGRLLISVRTFFGQNGGAIYLLRQLRQGGAFGTMRWLQAFPDGSVLNGPGKLDLRLSMAVDSSNGLHMVLPYIVDLGQGRRANRLLYVYADPDDTTQVDSTKLMGESQVLADGLEAVPGDIDIDYNGGDRLAVVWTTRKPGLGVKVGYAELEPKAPGVHSAWERATYSLDVTPKLASKKNWRDKINLSAMMDRVSIASTIDVDVVGSPGMIPQVATIVRSSVAPRIRYLHPDVAAPGMNVVVEMYANPRELGSFGPDGFRGDSVQLILANRSDSDRVVVGPTVVSWDGRLASTMIFVKPGAALGPVPLRLDVGATLSNVEMFEIVQPQHIGDSDGVLIGGGQLGSGGGYGIRSKRGVLVVDSLIMRSGTFTVDTSDCDPETPGNQGFLPLTILSRGPVRIESGAVLSASARNFDLARQTVAGPGGGGGGSGGGLPAGSGYTGGGGIVNPNAGSLLGASMGSGGIQSGFMSGGGALNDVPGGSSFVDAPGGGGTGHPFGASGLFGQISPTEPIGRNSGGKGGGTGGIGVFADGLTGGGGGGNDSGGIDGVDATGARNVNHNGGGTVGSRQLVPLAGGSGGGGGGYRSGGLSTGGSGGGAIAIVSYSSLQINGKIEANGSDGMNFSNAISAGGGGGAGGGILLAAQGTLSFGQQGAVRAIGGLGGPGAGGGVRGGDGSVGRVRVDGKLNGTGSTSIIPAPKYIGPASGMSTIAQAQVGSVISGFGAPNSVIRVFKRAERGTWSWREKETGTDGIWRDTLETRDVIGGRLYVVAMQQVNSPSRTPFTYEPSWVMSPAGANILGRAKINVRPDSIRFACIRFDSCAFSDITIENQGEMSDLILSDIKIVGPGADAFRVETESSGVSIGSGSSRTLRVHFCPDTSGSFEAELVMRTNVESQGEKRVKLAGCATSGVLVPNMIDIDLGQLCIDDCRDTVITFRNGGQAPLTIQGVSGEINEIEVTDVHRVLPLTLKPGESRGVAIRLCVERFDDAGSQIFFKSTTIDSLVGLRVHGVNGAPMPGLPAAIEFGMVNPSNADSCATRDVVIHNRNGKVAMRLKDLDLISRNFEIIEEPANGLIPPGGSATLKIRFCAGVEGIFAETLRLTFEGTSCTLDTVVHLEGMAALEKARYVMIEPDTASRELLFPPTIVGETSAEKIIIIKNVGGATGSSIDLVVTNSSEFIPSRMTIPAIEPGKAETLSVVMKPSAIGDRSGRIELSSVGPVWSEYVIVSGRGTKQGMQVAPVVVNFGEVCVGSRSAVQEILVYNNGTAPGRVEGVGTIDPHFVFEGSSRPIPTNVLAPPSNDTLRLRYHFAADAEGSISADLVINIDGAPQHIRFVGKGIKGKMTIDRTSIDFACSDAVRTFTLINDGACEMVVGGMQVTSGENSFTIDPSHQFPQTIAAGERMEFQVHYSAGFNPVDGSIEIETSDPAHSAVQRFTVALHGDACGTGGDVQKLTIIVPNASAVMGEGFMLPLMAKLNFSKNEELPYEVTISYAEDLLIPRLAPRADAPVKTTWSDGTISTVESMEEVRPGTLVIKGSIGRQHLSGSPGSPVSAPLVNIPFKVLLGSTHSTTVAVENVTIDGPIAIGKQPGLFVALDCDTTGNISINGSYALDQNSPNPFNPSTIIRYNIGRRERVRLNLYDAMGNFIRVLFDEEQAPGRHEYRFDASGLPSGIYTYELVSGPFKKSRRMVLFE